MILTRGNGYAGYKLNIPIASFPMQMTINRMTDFKISWSLGDYGLKIPRLTPDEVAAVEWFWVNTLKCPAM